MIFVFLVAVSIQCTDQSPTKSSLSANSLRNLVEKHPDLAALIDGTIQDHSALINLGPQKKTQFQDRANLLISQYQNGASKESDVKEFENLLDANGFSRKTMPAFVSLYNSLSKYNYKEDDLIKILNDKMVNEANLLNNHSSRTQLVDLSFLNSCGFKCFVAGAEQEGTYYRVFMTGCMIGCEFL